MISTRVLRVLVVLTQKSWAAALDTKKRTATSCRNFLHGGREQRAIVTLVVLALGLAPEDSVVP